MEYHSLSLLLSLFFSLPSLAGSNLIIWLSLVNARGQRQRLCRTCPKNENSPFYDGNLTNQTVLWDNIYLKRCALATSPQIRKIRIKLICFSLINLLVYYLQRNICYYHGIYHFFVNNYFIFMHIIHSFINCTEIAYKPTKIIITKMIKRLFIVAYFWTKAHPWCYNCFDFIWTSFLFDRSSCRNSSSYFTMKIIPLERIVSFYFWYICIICIF